MTKDWKIASTVVIAVAIPPVMAAWFMAAMATSGPLRSLIWDFAFWGWPNWIGSIITVAFTALWFGLPLGGVVCPAQDLEKQGPEKQLSHNWGQ